MPNTRCLFATTKRKTTADGQQTAPLVEEANAAAAECGDDCRTSELVASNYRQSVRIAESVSPTPEMPRVTGRQQHRSNPSSFSVEDYFKKTVAIPLLDHIITSMKDRFFAAAIVASFLLGVIPSVCCSREVSMERAIEKYKDDLPSPELTSTELRRQKARMPVELRPSTPAAAIKDCDSDLYPNVKVLLQIACTLPVTSCECERSASALRRLHN